MKFITSVDRLGHDECPRQRGAVALPRPELRGNPLLDADDLQGLHRLHQLLLLRGQWPQLRRPEQAESAARLTVASFLIPLGHFDPFADCIFDEITLDNPANNGEVEFDKLPVPHFNRH